MDIHERRCWVDQCYHTIIFICLPCMWFDSYPQFCIQYSCRNVYIYLTACVCVCARALAYTKDLRDVFIVSGLLFWKTYSYIIYKMHVFVQISKFLTWVRVFRQFYLISEWNINNKMFIIAMKFNGKNNTRNMSNEICVTWSARVFFLHI